MEEWKDIEGYEGIYQVSNEGRVRRIKNHKFLRQADLRGYKRVGLSKNGKVSWKQVHRLVAIAFIPNPYNKEQVDHINTIRDDNRSCNLRWVNVRENNQNPITRNRRIGSMTNREDQSKKVGQVKDGCVIRIYDSISEAARSGYCLSSVARCCNGIRQTHKGYGWVYI